MLLDSERPAARREFKEKRPDLKHVKGAFAAYQAEMQLKGYSPLPLRPDTKIPLQENWSRACETPLDPDVISKIIKDAPKAGLGVACGYNNLVGIDIDTDVPEIIDAITAVLPEAVVSKKGRRGFTAFYRSSTPIASRRFRSKKKETLVEILAVGKQSVSPPTIHPDTGEQYQWLTQATLFNTRIENLPLIPDNIADLIEAAIAKWIEKPEDRVNDGLAQSTVRASDLSESDRKRYQGVAAFALNAWANEIATTPKGSRNETLYRGVCRIGQLVHYNFIDRRTVEEVLKEACNRNGLTHDIGPGAVRLTIESGFKKSENDPLRALNDRERPGPDGKRPNPEAKASSGSAWREPQKLPNGLPPVASFDFEMLPEKTRAWGEDIATMMQAPPDFLGVNIMAGLGATTGRKIGIRPMEYGDWTVTANQWGLTIGRPSTKKSPSMDAALAPLAMLEARANKEYKEKSKEIEILIKINDIKAKLALREAEKSLKKSADADVTNHFKIDDIETLILRRYKTNDTTCAALGEILIENPNGVLVVRDELVSLFQNFEREDNAGDRGFYLTSWNGNSPYTIDRIGRGRNLYIPGVCLSLLGTTQPGKIARYVSSALRGGAGDDGLIQRLGLMVWPDVPPDWQDIDRPLNAEAKRRAFEVYERLNKLDPLAIDAAQDTDFNGEPEGIPYLRFTPAALEIFREWHGKLQRRMRGDDIHQAMESHLAKYSKLVPSLALISHLADGRAGHVGERDLLRALAWAEYLETHARRVYASV